MPSRPSEPLFLTVRRCTADVAFGSEQLLLLHDGLAEKEVISDLLEDRASPRTLDLLRQLQNAVNDATLGAWLAYLTAPN